MVIEVPDWVRSVQLIGQDPEGNPVLVATDANGQLHIVIQGELAGITGSVTVDQSEKDREIQGADGATLRTIAVDANGQIIMVPRGQSGNYLVVDADGFLATLMKALYAGTTLKTVACDDQGRMIMIPTDPADVWGNAISMGNAELAARLAGFSSLDRRGNLIFGESFEHGVGHVSFSLQGTDAEYYFATEESNLGGVSLVLIGGSDGNKSAKVYRYLGYPLNRHLGLEAWFRIGNNVDRFHFSILVNDGTNLKEARVRYDNTNEKWQYLDSSNTWQDLLTSISLYSVARLFYPLKLVADFENNIYQRLLVSDQEVDMSTYAIRSTLSAVAPLLTVEIEVYSETGLNGWILLDPVMLTQNEPAQA